MFIFFWKNFNRPLSVFIELVIFFSALIQFCQFFSLFMIRPIYEIECSNMAELNCIIKKICNIMYKFR